MHHAKDILSNKYSYLTLAAVYFLFISFPGIYTPIQTGLDNSWVYAINFLANSDYKLGQDVFFTFGPLGYLLYPLNIQANLIYGLIFQFIVYFVFVLTILFLSYKSKYFWPILYFILATIIVFVLSGGLSYEYLVLVVIGLLFCTYFLYRDSRIRYLVLPLAGALASLATFLKLNTGLAAFLTLLVCLVLQVWKNRKNLPELLLLCFVPYLTLTIVLSAIYFGSPAALIGWIKTSSELISGYSTAMSIEGHTIVLIAGILILVIFLLLFILDRSWKTNFLYPALIFGVPLAFAFKHGFCRFDAHCLLFFLFSLSVLSIFILLSQDKRQLKLSVSAFLITLVLSIPFTMMYADIRYSQSLIKRISNIDGLGHIVSFIYTGNSGHSEAASQAEDNHNNAAGKSSAKDYSELLRIAISLGDSAYVKGLIGNISGINGYNKISSLWNFNDTRLRLDELGRNNLEKDRLPHDWVGLIHEIPGTVDVIPAEIAYCPANDLIWNPNPVMQTYSAYTSYLDELSAKHYSDSGAPDFIIFDYADIDERHPLLSTPATLRSVIKNYQLIRQDIENNRLLFHKRDDSQMQQEDVVVRRSTEHLNTWITVPQTDKLLLADIDMNLSFPGTCMGTVLRVPPIFIDLVYDSGEKVSYRLVPDTAKNGLLINYLPLNAQGFSQLMQGYADKEVKQFRISGPGTSLYKNKMSIVWKEMPYPIKVAINNENEVDSK